MNNKGQSLILFVILIPIFFTCCALIIDAGIMLKEKTKAKDLLNYALKNEYDVKDYFNINEIKLENVKYIEKKNKECVIINYHIGSVFGKVIGYKKYEIKAEKCN